MLSEQVIAHLCSSLRDVARPTFGEIFNLATAVLMVAAVP
jgi:hypothetical protein